MRDVVKINHDCNTYNTTLLINYYENDCDNARVIYLLGNSKLIVSDDWGGAYELKTCCNGVFPVVPTNQLVNT